jgi:hypothetical protein
MGVEVLVRDDGPPNPPLYHVEVYDAIDSEAGEQPIEQTENLTRRATLAYLHGLECGARIQNVRHAALVATATECIYDLERHVKHQGPGPDKRLAALREALSQLEGVEE